MTVERVATMQQTAASKTPSSQTSSSLLSVRPASRSASTESLSPSVEAARPGVGAAPSMRATTPRPVPVSRQETIEEVLYPGKLVADYWQWPVFFAILPPVFTVYYGGRVGEWTEGFLLAVIGFYLYGLIKLPWELYVSSKLQRSQWNRVAVAYQTSDIDSRHPGEVARQQSAWRLWLMEWVYFVLVFASPLGGAVFLRYIRPHLHVYQNILNDFPMALYVLTAYIRPFIHLSRLLKHSAQQLKEEVTHDQVAINQLNARMASVEQRVADLTALYQAAFDETDRKMRHTLESTVEPTLKGLNKDMRRTVRKEQRFMEYSVDRFRVLEQRLLEQELAIAEHRAAMDGHEWKQRNRPLLRPAYWLLDAVPSASSVVWFPISMAVRLTTWWIPKYLLPARLTNAVATNSNGPTRRASIMYSSADAFHQQVDTPTSPLPKSHHRRSGTVDDSSSGTAQNQHQHLPHRRRQSSEATFAGVVSPTNLTQPNGVRSTSSSLESMASSTTSRRVPTIMTGDVDEM